LQDVVADPVAAPTTQSAAAQPLAGHHVLVLATRREVRNLIRQALRPMGLMLDFAGSVEEARLVCADGLPHALVYEASLGGSRFERLRDEMLDQLPTLAFVRVEEDGRAVEVINAGNRQITSVGRDAIIQSLPAALQDELARNG
jgi:DNA-binding NtrC family response regulator